MNRRMFLKAVLGVPLLGAAVLFMSPMFRYLKPTAGVFPEGLISEPDKPQSVRNIEFSLSLFAKPWDSQEFLYEQQNPEYTRDGKQISRIPGFAVRLPGKSDSDFQFIVVSRICPHMGCIFNYVQDPHVVEEGYNYHPPKGTPQFACPCHLSVYDPLQETDVEGKIMRGKVVSGPAPRPPRQFEFHIDTNKQVLVITRLEQGGIA